MSDYHISQILTNDKREIKKLDALLEKEGIERDKHLDYTIGLYNDDYQLAATGSCFGNTLRCMAVDSSHQGEGLLNQVVSHLIEYEFNRGFTDLFLYTKCDKALFFKDLGFYEIARVQDRVVFMENKKQGFSSYLKKLRQETIEPVQCPPAVGAVIMNANPFTLGHLHLLETAAASVDLLHVFVVSEDVSLIPFSIRFRLVKEGASHLKNLVFHETGSYMISNATFPSYFLKDEESIIRSHAELDIAVFKEIAAALSITSRFVGEEPLSQVTAIYNQVMKEELEQAGITCQIIPRKSGGDGIISASVVRELLYEEKMEMLNQYVPETTYRYFTSSEAAPVLEAIRKQKKQDIAHY